MENQEISASDIAKRRLYEFIENLILISTFNDVALWGLFNFLLEQVKNYNPNNYNISAAYQQDRIEAQDILRQREALQKEKIAPGNQIEINLKESEISHPERSVGRSM